MNIQEMHIEINLSLQKIASNVKRKFLSQEIDWVINKQIGRFVKNKINSDVQTTVDPQTRARVQIKTGGFENNSIDLNALRTLVVTKPVSIYRPSASNFVCAELPGDYSYYIDSLSGIVRDCHDTFAKASNFIEQAEYLYLLKIPKPNKTTSPYYGSPELSVNGTIVIPNTEFQAALPDKDMGFVLEGILKNKLLSKDSPYKVYWENYNGVQKSDTFIFVSPILLSSVTLTFDAQVVTATTMAALILKPEIAISKKQNQSRLIKDSNVYNLLTSKFHRTKWESPITTIGGNRVFIYHDETFIVNNLDLKYIRKPRTVSLDLGQGCDLPEEFHNDICDWTVEYIKQTISDPSYQLKVADTQLRGE